MKIRGNLTDQANRLVGPICFPARLPSAVSQTQTPFAIIKPRQGFQVIGLDFFASSYTATLSLDGFLSGPTELISATALTINAVPEKFDATAFRARVGGRYVQKAAAAALTFTAGHIVSANKYGVVRVQMNNAGAISTKVPAATQAYNTLAEAILALPAADSDKVAIGHIRISNNAGDWTANTDNLTNGSDVTTATFHNEAATVVSLFTGAITPVAAENVAGVLSGTLAAIQDKNGTKDIILHYTTDGAGAVTNGTANLWWRPYPGHGESF